MFAIDRVALRVGQDPVFENLEQDVEKIGMRLFYFVEQHDRVRRTSKLLGQLAALIVPYVSGRGANELRDRMLFHVLAHVEANQHTLRRKKIFRECAGDFRFSDTCRSEEKE